MLLVFPKAVACKIVYRIIATAGWVQLVSMMVCLIVPTSLLPQLHLKRRLFSLVRNAGREGELVGCLVLQGYYDVV